MTRPILCLPRRADHHPTLSSRREALSHLSNGSDAPCEPLQPSSISYSCLASLPSPHGSTARSTATSPSSERRCATSNAASRERPGLRRVPSTFEDAGQPATRIQPSARRTMRRALVLSLSLFWLFPCQAEARPDSASRDDISDLR